jgi:cysteinyl-tRNA synthetase
MHNGFLQVEGEKMSKSLGNFITIRELLETDKFGGRSWDGPMLRHAMLRTQYRQPIDWTLRALEQCDTVTRRWLTIADMSVSHVRAAKKKLSVDAVFAAALLDDLNTPLALSELGRIENSLQDEFDPNAAQFIAGLLLLGIIPDESYLSGQRAIQNPLAAKYAGEGVTQRDVAILEKNGVDFSDVNFAIQDRLAARRAKNFKESDRIRDELAAKGIVLKDGPTGTTWEVKR